MSQKQDEAQADGAANCPIAGNRGWLTYYNYMTRCLLGFWNASLFIGTIPGWVGWLTGFVAVNLEATGSYCLHNYTRSIGDHKKWLGRFAVILGLVSLIHAVLAIVHHTGYAGDSPVISFYTNVLALPIIVILLSVTITTLTMKKTV